MSRKAASAALDSIASDAKKARIGKKLTEEQRAKVYDFMAKLGIADEEAEESEETEDSGEEG